MSVHERLAGLDPTLLTRIDDAQCEVDWLTSASGADLVALAADQLGLKPLRGFGEAASAAEFGDLPHRKLVGMFDRAFEAGTGTAVELADQIQLCRAFGAPSAVTEALSKRVVAAIAGFPRTGADLRVGSNPGDVLDPFILAANFELLSGRSMEKAIEHSAAHKVLMKIEDLVGHLHESVIGSMRGNFRVPEPRGGLGEGKEGLHPTQNPFPGADVGQVPTSERPEALRLFQVKSKTGSAKGGDGKRLGEQLRRLEETYEADTFYVAVVGNTLRGHRSRGAVSRESPQTAILVGEAALDELTRSQVGGELLLKAYQRAFRRASVEAGYEFAEAVGVMTRDFGADDTPGTGVLEAWLHTAIGGPRSDQDSRLERGDLGSRR